MYLGCLNDVWSRVWLLQKSVKSEKVGFVVAYSKFSVGVFLRSNRHERAAFQRSAFGRLTDGNDVVATILINLFSAVTFSHRRSARIKKTHLVKDA